MRQAGRGRAGRTRCRPRPPARSTRARTPRRRRARRRCRRPPAPPRRRASPGGRPRSRPARESWQPRELAEVGLALLEERLLSLATLLGHVVEERGVAGELLQAGLAVAVGVE